MMNTNRFFFAQDSDSHWYLVPERLYSIWHEMTRNDPETNEAIEEFNEIFSEHRMDGGISHTSFCDPWEISES